MPKTPITGGNFQSAAGTPLANGYVTFRLNKDAVVGNVQVSSRILVTLPLDARGDLSGAIWPNDQMTPTDTVYFVRAYTAQGQLVWEAELYISTQPFPLPNDFLLLNTGYYVRLNSGGRVQLNN